MIGQIVGNYKITQKLGEGGMGAVYRGVDMMLEREVAIKVLRPELASQPQVVERFRSEAVTLAKLNHPNIATLYSFLRQGDRLLHGDGVRPRRHARPRHPAARRHPRRAGHPASSARCSTASSTRTARASSTATSSPPT